MHHTQVERTRRLRDSQKAKGLKSVTVTVPADRVEDLKAIAKKMRAKSLDTSKTIDRKTQQ